jgi:hypothetical protein
MEGNGLTRRQIMRELPKIKNKTNFFRISKRIGLFPVDEVREGHVNTGLYPADSIERLRKELDKGDLRLQSWE